MEKMDSLNPLVLDPPCSDLDLDIPIGKPAVYSGFCILPRSRYRHRDHLNVDNSRRVTFVSKSPDSQCFDVITMDNVRPLYPDD